MRFKQLILKIFLIGSFSLLIYSCNTNQHTPYFDLKISFIKDPATLDPLKASDFSSSTLACMLYEGLTRLSQDGTIELALAEKIEISPDGKTYVFTLKKAFWSNKQPIDAYDFEKSWKKALTLPSPCVYLFYPIKNCEKYLQKKASLQEVAIHAISANKLKVELEHPTPYFTALTAQPCYLATKHDQKVYSGPFILDKKIEHSELILKKNPNYWNRENIHLNNIQISIIPNEMTAFEMFEKKELDWLAAPLAPIPQDAINQLPNKQSLLLVPSHSTTFISFNTDRRPFHNKNLRKALSFAINRNEIVEEIAPYGHIAATQVLPPLLSHNQTPQFNSYDPKLAQKHFEQALFEDEFSKKDLEQLTLWFKPSPIDKKLAQAIQKQWEKVLGIHIKISAIDPQSHTQKLQDGNYDLAISGWIAPFEDPISILERFKRKEDPKNFPSWQNQKFSTLLEKSFHSSKRLETLHLAENILAEEMPIAPIYHLQSIALKQDRIKKAPITPSGAILFEKFEIQN